MASIYDFKVMNRQGEEVSLKDFEGKVLLIVNTATGCGFTPHYAPLEEMYKQYHDQGLEVLDFPCNQFGHQAPGTDDEIHEFCTSQYQTTFDQFAKIDVNGEHAIPLYQYLTSQKGFKGFDTSNETGAFMDEFLKKDDPDYASTPSIKWNFTKFLVDRNGSVVERFEPTEDMAKVEAAVKEQLAK